MSEEYQGIFDGEESLLEGRAEAALLPEADKTVEPRNAALGAPSPPSKAAAAQRPEPSALRGDGSAPKGVPVHLRVEVAVVAPLVGTPSRASGRRGGVDGPHQRRRVVSVLRGGHGRRREPGGVGDDALSPPIHRAGPGRLAPPQAPM